MINIISVRRRFVYCTWHIYVHCVDDVVAGTWQVDDFHTLTAPPDVCVLTVTHSVTMNTLELRVKSEIP